MQLQNLQLEFAQAIDEDLSIESAYPCENICIYQNNIQISLRQALEATYPLILALIGESFFRVIAKEYIHQYPARSPNLYDYGEYFSGFIAEHSSLKNLTYLSEVAQFEWYCHLIVIAPNHDGLDISLLEKLESDQYETIQFVLHPASKLMKCHFPILRIIDLCQKKIEETLNLEEGGVNLLIIRRDFDIHLVPLSLAEFAFLQSVENSCSLAQALSAALNTGVPFQLETLLPTWIKNKTIVDCVNL